MLAWVGAGLTATAGCAASAGPAGRDGRSGAAAVARGRNRVDGDRRARRRHQSDPGGLARARRRRGGRGLPRDTRRRRARALDARPPRRSRGHHPRPRHLWARPPGLRGVRAGRRGPRPDPRGAGANHARSVRPRRRTGRHPRLPAPAPTHRGGQPVRLRRAPRPGGGPRGLRLALVPGRAHGRADPATGRDPAPDPRPGGRRDLDRQRREPGAFGVGAARPGGHDRTGHRGATGRGQRPRPGPDLAADLDPRPAHRPDERGCCARFR